MNSFVNNVNKNFTHIENNYNVFNRNGWDRFSNNWNNNNHWGNWNNHGSHYGDWYHGSWHGNYGSGWGYGAGLATGALVSSWAMGPSVYSSGYYEYSNPYYTEPLVIQVDSGQPTVIDYGQPLQLTAPLIETDTSGIPAEEIPAPVTEDSATLFDQARDAFDSRDYQGALNLANKILADNPNDPVVHQFRALVLFAQKDYRQATAALYSILSVGPPWDWTTMSGLYADTDTYSEEFHALEDFATQNPQAAYARFLLGYHYMVCGYTDEAIAEFKKTVELEPSDRLAASMVDMLGGNVTDSPAPATDPVELDEDIVEVDPSTLFGNWLSGRPNGPPINLSLDQDGQFIWTVGEGDSKQVMEGEYSLGGDKLALQPDSGSPMMGTVNDVAEDKFVFRIVGAPPGDKGLEFMRK